MADSKGSHLISWRDFHLIELIIACCFCQSDLNLISIFNNDCLNIIEVMSEKRQISRGITRGQNVEEINSAKASRARKMPSFLPPPISPPRPIMADFDSVWFKINLWKVCATVQLLHILGSLSNTYIHTCTHHAHTYLLLTEFEGRTVSYGPSFFLLDLWPKREARGP